jgi:hypothetical protein
MRQVIFVPKSEKFIGKVVFNAPKWKEKMSFMVTDVMSQFPGVEDMNSLSQVQKMAMFLKFIPYAEKHIAEVSLISDDKEYKSFDDLQDDSPYTDAVCMEVVMFLMGDMLGGAQGQS